VYLLALVLQVNLHKSGLKVTIKTPEEIAADARRKALGQPLQSSSSTTNAASNFASRRAAAPTRVIEIVHTGAEAVPQLGWRKYILFGPRREVSQKPPVQL
jgi:hypothetical protein